VHQDHRKAVQQAQGRLCVSVISLMPAICIALPWATQPFLTNSVFLSLDHDCLIHQEAHNLVTENLYRIFCSPPCPCHMRVTACLWRKFAQHLSAARFLTSQCLVVAPGTEELLLPFFARTHVGAYCFSGWRAKRPWKCAHALSKCSASPLTEQLSNFTCHWA